MGCPGMSILWASGAASLYLWSRSEKAVEVLRRLSTARSRIVAGIRNRRRPTPLRNLPVPYGSCQTRYPAATVPTSTAP